MSVPFTVEQFLDNFRRYNQAVWPLQLVLVLLALLAVALAARGTRAATRGALLTLAALWAWTGAVYHLAFFRAINPAAIAFGVLFLAETLLLVWTARPGVALRFRVDRDARTAIGGVLVIYALLLYPAIGYALGHRYPAAPTFGLPCPTTIFTLGLLLWTTPPAPWTVVVIPAAWAAIATTAATRFGMAEDYALPIAAVLTVVLLAFARHGLRQRASGTVRFGGTS